jgi:MFS family permease
MKNPPVLLRWTVLLVISLAMMGNYYVYDSISPLADMLKKQLGYSDTAIGTLNAIYSFPNLFMVLVGGIIIDRIGTRRASILFSFLVMIGSVITCLKGNLVVMATGRLIFGLGAESMIVAITTTIAQWFKGKKLSFAFGINLSVARCGSWLALNSPSWAHGIYDKGWQGPLIIAASAGALTLVFIGLYFLIAKVSQKHYDVGQEEKPDHIDVKNIFNFSKSFWLISLLCVVFYAGMFPFQTFAVKFFQHVHHTGSDTGGFLSSMLTATAMFCTPFFGLLADHIGKRSWLMMLGSILIIPVYLMMVYGVDLVSFLGLPQMVHIKFSLFSIDINLSPNLLIPMAIMGLAFSLVPAVMWPAVSLVVEHRKLGTAYGLMTMIQSCGLVLFNLLIGFTNDINHASEFNPKGYIPGMWIFSICGILGVVFALLLHQASKKGAVNLDRPTHDN